MVGGAATGTGRAGGVQTRRSQAGAAAGSTSEAGGVAGSKRMKTDDEQRVSELFSSAIRFEGAPIDISVKKFVYKLISDVSNSSGSGKVSISSIWQRYFTMPDDQQKNVATSRAFLNSKEDLK